MMNNPKPISEFLVPDKRAHLVGIGGVSMCPLAEVLAGKGLLVQGSDMTESDSVKHLRSKGISVAIGHNAENLGDCDFVIRTAAVHDGNPEIAGAIARGIPVYERAQAWGALMRKYPNALCVSGTHGKTTTTGMITTMLELAGKDPAAVIGGKLPLIGGYGKAGHGDDVVIEACEYSETFLHLTPFMGVILNIDNDHLEYYGTMGRLKMAFQKFALLSRTVVFNMDDRNTVDVVNSIDRPVFSFGINEEARFRAVNIQEYRPGFYEFDVLELGEQFAHIKLGVPGYHNIYNALAMCCCARPLGLQPADAERAAAEFHGTGRRFEIKGECNGAPVVDDYAHHPTELAATMATAKKMGYKRIIAVHQPFTYSRTKALMDDFAAVLRQADQCVLLPIMGSREVDDGSVKSEDLAAKIPGSIVVDGLESAANWVKQNAREGDLVVCMSCGDLYKACDMMVGKA